MRRRSATTKSSTSISSSSTSSPKSKTPTPSPASPSPENSPLALDLTSPQVQSFIKLLQDHHTKLDLTLTVFEDQYMARTRPDLSRLSPRRQSPARAGPSRPPHRRNDSASRHGRHLQEIFRQDDRIRRPSLSLRPLHRRRHRQHGRIRSPSRTRTRRPGRNPRQLRSCKTPPSTPPAS